MLCSASVSFWVVIQCRPAIFTFVAPRRHLFSAENVPAVNTH
jgi:hypothetical protein